jgi:hypothetical protein
MKAYLHIGMPKTGTTSIQGWLALNAKGLAKQGIAYDRLNLQESGSQTAAHTELTLCQYAEMGELTRIARIRRLFGAVDLDRQKDVAERYARKLGDAVSARDEPIMVLSSEVIGSSSKTLGEARAIIRWLKRIFDDVHVIVYFRRQEDWLLSHYSQSLRSGLKRNLAPFIRDQAAQDYDALASLWAEAAGPDRLHVRLMEADAMKNRDLLADFAEVIGVNPDGFGRPDIQNQGMSVETAEFLRILNRRLQPVHEGEGARSNPLMHNVQNFLNSLSAEGTKLRLSASQVGMVRKANAASNARLRAAYFPDRAELFPAKRQHGDPAEPVSAEVLANIGISLYALARTGQLPPVENKPGLISDVSGAVDTDERGRS